MDSQSDANANDDLGSIKDMRRQLETRIESSAAAQTEVIGSLRALIPDIVSCLDLSLKVVSAFNARPFTPLSIPDHCSNPNRKPKRPLETASSLTPETQNRSSRLRSAEPKPEPKPNRPRSDSQQKKASDEAAAAAEVPPESEKFTIDESGSPLSVVRSMVAVCLLERVPFKAIDSAMVLRKLEGDQSATTAEKAALREIGGESGAILAVELALRSMSEDNGGVELEPFVDRGKSRVMVVGIDRTRLLKELPESAQYQQPHDSNSANGMNPNQNLPVGVDSSDANGGGFGMGRPVPRKMQDMFSQQIFSAPGGAGLMMGPKGVSRFMGMVPGGMVVPPLYRPPMGPNAPVGGPIAVPLKVAEENDMKDIEALLNKKSYREKQKSKTGEELLDLIHRPTARETAVAAKFKTKGGSHLKEYCTALTKEDCRRQSGSYIACEKSHFRRIIALHTDTTLGDCSFLDTCRHMKTCKYVHYELDPTSDMLPMTVPLPRQLKQRAEYCSEVELGEPQWINCDIRNFRMDILGQFGVIMADPPWDIHMELPYGTMADDEMRTLNVPALQTDGLIFLWVTGRAMELGRECLELWGYKRVEEIIWVKTNQLQRIIRTGRTGHWLNHSKEHCLVGIKGNPEVNRNIDTDVIVAEVRETSRKPDEMYPLLERISPRTRKLELFARMHNTYAGWLSLGNQLNGARLVDEGLRARFKAAYPDVEVEPLSPPRTSTMELDSNAAPLRNSFAELESKPSGMQFEESAVPDTGYTCQEKPMASEGIDTRS